MNALRERLNDRRVDIAVQDFLLVPRPVPDAAQKLPRHSTDVLRIKGANGPAIILRSAPKDLVNGCGQGHDYTNVSAMFGLWSIGHDAEPPCKIAVRILGLCHSALSGGLHEFGAAATSLISDMRRKR